MAKATDFGKVINRFYGCVKLGGSLDEPNDCGLVSCNYCLVSLYLSITYQKYTWMLIKL